MTKDNQLGVSGIIVTIAIKLRTIVEKGKIYCAYIYISIKDFSTIMISRFKLHPNDLIFKLLPTICW